MTTAGYQAAFRDQIMPEDTAAPYRMIRYGVWLSVIPVLQLEICFVAKQTNTPRSLMNEAAGINQQARETIERGAPLQEEVVGISRPSLALHTETNRLLEAIRNELRL